MNSRKCTAANKVEWGLIVLAALYFGIHLIVSVVRGI